MLSRYCCQCDWKQEHLDYIIFQVFITRNIALNLRRGIISLSFCTCLPHPPNSLFLNPLRRHSVQHATINRQNLSIDIVISRKQQNPHANFLVSSRSHHRNMSRRFNLFLRKLRLLSRIGFIGRHFGWEVARCNAATRNSVSQKRK